MIENNNEYKVYCLLFPNGKRYIGSTKLSMTKRIRTAKYEQQKRVQAAIDKFGIKNVEVIVLCEGLTWEGAHETEQKFIDYYDVLNPEHGYNTQKVLCNQNSEEARRKNRESSLKFYEEHPQKAKEISANLRKYYDKHPEAKLYLRSVSKCNPVRCLDTGIVYPSITNCGKSMHISPGSIRYVCMGMRNHANGYTFAYV